MIKGDTRTLDNGSYCHTCCALLGLPSSVPHALQSVATEHHFPADKACRKASAD